MDGLSVDATGRSSYEKFDVEAAVKAAKDGQKATLDAHETLLFNPPQESIVKKFPLISKFVHYAHVKVSNIDIAIQDVR